jgi:hypothetical protein
MRCGRDRRPLAFSWRAAASSSPDPARRGHHAARAVRAEGHLQISWAQRRFPAVVCSCGIHPSRCGLDRSLQSYLGGMSSLASQPAASVRTGSTGVASFSMWPQVEHLNVSSWKPLAPGETRSTVKGCLHFRHDGLAMAASLSSRSTRITIPPVSGRPQARPFIEVWHARGWPCLQSLSAVLSCRSVMSSWDTPATIVIVFPTK